MVGQKGLAPIRLIAAADSKSVLSTIPALTWKVVGSEGLEPSRSIEQQILSLPRLPNYDMNPLVPKVGIGPTKWQSQSLLPYRLATSEDSGTLALSCTRNWRL